nr:EamA family transporter [Nocardia yamanashiensis]
MRATGWSLGSWVLFASSGPLAKGVMDAGWSAGAVAAVRIGVAAVLLMGVVAVVRPGALRFRWGDLWVVGGYGVLGVAGVQGLFFVAVERVPVGVAMVLVGLAPVLVALWVRVVRGVRVAGVVWAGVGAGVVGLGMVAEVWRGGGLDLGGMAAGVGAAVCSAGYFLLGEHGARRFDALGLTAAGLSVGAVVSVAVAAPWGVSGRLLSAPATFGDRQVAVWVVLSVLAVGGTVVPYLAGLYAMRELPVAVAGVLSVVEPLVAAGLTWLLLGQGLGVVQMVGAVIMIVGAAAVQIAVPQDVPAAGQEVSSGRGCG